MPPFERPSASERHKALLASAGYEVITLLGEGAYGAVHAVRRRDEREVIAAKLLLEVTPDALARIKGEFHVLAGLQHRNVVRCYGLEPLAGNNAVLTMEYVQGKVLTEHLGAPRPDSVTWRTQLVASFHSLSRGLAYLHANGVLHRDLKPTNVIVEPDGRAVLVDFGLANRQFADSNRSASVVGTLAYAAPEVLLGRACDEASDWFGVGVMLQEALTGQLDRAPREDLLHLFGQEVVTAIARLLQADPETRGGADDVLRACHALDATTDDLRLDTLLDTAPFVAREAEFAMLGARHARVESSGQPHVVWIHGTSGLGKTRLVREWLGTTTDAAYVLPTRCHSSETVRFGVLDPIADELGRILLARGHRSIRVTDRAGLADLLRMFPALKRVRALAREAGSELVSSGPPVRSAAMRALRELLVQISADRPVVLWIDDAQWGDRDSLEPLASVLVGDRPPRVLLVMTSRDENYDETPPPFSIALAALLARAGIAVEQVDLPPLGADAARTLVLSLGATAGTGARAGARTEAGTQAALDHAIATCAGNPMLLQQLGWEVAASGMGSDDPMAARFEHLSADARRVARIVCVAGHPIAIETMLNTQLGTRGIHDELCSRGWLRTARYRGMACLDSYHDLIRAHITSGVDRGETVAIHARIAAALATEEEPNPLELVVHYRASNDSARALDYAVSAAIDAEAQSAYALAGELFGMASELEPDPAHARALLVRKAGALKSDRRFMEASDAFMDAQARFAASHDTPASEAALLEAASSLYFGGAIRQGQELLARYGAMVGIPVTDAMLRWMPKRIRVALRPPPLAVRQPTEAERRSVARLAQVAHALTHVDVSFAAPVVLEWLTRAAAVGDRTAYGQALALEASSQAMTGPLFGRSARRLLRLARAHLPRDATSRVELYGVLAHIAFSQGNWEDVWRRTAAAERVHARIAQAAGAQGATFLSYHMSATVMLGKLRYMAQRLPALARDAHRRRDLLDQSNYEGALSAYGWLAMDRAQQTYDSIMALRGEISVGRFTSHSFYECIGLVPTLLYQNQATEAFEYVESIWPGVAKAGFGFLPAQYMLLVSCRALAAAGAFVHSQHGATRKQAKAALRASIKALRGSSLPCAAAHAAVAKAALAYAASARGALEHLDVAQRVYGTQGMRMHQAAVARRIAQIKGERGDELHAEERFVAEGVVRPDAMARCYVSF